MSCDGWEATGEGHGKQVVRVVLEAEGKGGGGKEKEVAEGDEEGVDWKKMAKI